MATHLCSFCSSSTPKELLDEQLDRLNKKKFACETWLLVARCSVISCCTEQYLVMFDWQVGMENIRRAQALNNSTTFIQVAFFAFHLISFSSAVKELGHAC